MYKLYDLYVDILDFTYVSAASIVNAVMGSFNGIKIAYLFVAFIFIGHFVFNRLSVILRENSSIPVRFIRLIGNLLLSFHWIFVFVVILSFMMVSGFLDGSLVSRNILNTDFIVLVRNMHVGFIVSAVIGMFTGFTCSLFIGRKIEPLIDLLLIGNTSNVSRGSQRTDARDVAEHLPNIIKYDVRKQFDLKNKQVFFGVIGSKGKKLDKIMIDRDLWKKSHVQIVGPTGSGKGVMATCALTQSILYGDCVYVVDPKSDEWAPFVLKDACRKAKKPFIYINLSGSQRAQINPMLGCSSNDLEVLLVTGFGLEEKGRDSDFYRIGDRAAAAMVAAYYKDKESPNFRKIVDDLEKIIPDLDRAKSFVSILKEMARLESINPSETLYQLEDSLENGGCVYVVGSTTDPKVIRAMLMMTLRMMQIINNRDRTVDNRHVTMFLDEAKYQISVNTMRMLGVIRDKGCNVLLAHQSLGDFDDTILNPKAVRGSVDGNCRIKWIYGTDDIETIDWAIKKSGEIIAESEMSYYERNDELSEIKSPSVRLSETVRPLFDLNMIQQLPSKCAIVKVHENVAKLAFSSVIPVKKSKLLLVDGEFES